MLSITTNIEDSKINDVIFEKSKSLESTKTDSDNKATDSKVALSPEEASVTTTKETEISAPLDENRIPETPPTPTFEIKPKPVSSTLYCIYQN